VQFRAKRKLHQLSRFSPVSIHCAMDEPARIELPEWGGAAFGKRPLTARHTLHESSLFSDESLIALLDGYPRELLFAISMGSDPAREENRLAANDGASGRELLDAVKRGRLWLNITRVTQVDPRYRSLVDHLYSELAKRVPGFEPRSSQGTLLISSPGALVYYHADGPPNVLWHIRGRKKIWIYPALDERFLARKDLEDIFAGARHEYLPYSPEFDAHATCFELAPGDLAAWPQNAPHRVTNLDSVNVSLSTEHFTVESRARARVYSANRFLRNRLRLEDLSTRESGLGALAKTVVYSVARRMGLDGVSAGAKDRVPTLRISPESPFGVAELATEAALRS
jgi:cupin-like protein